MLDASCHLTLHTTLSHKLKVLWQPCQHPLGVEGTRAGKQMGLLPLVKPHKLRSKELWLPL